MSDSTPAPLPTTPAPEHLRELPTTEQVELLTKEERESIQRVVNLSETPSDVAEWMLRPRGKNPRPVAVHRAAIKQVARFVMSDTSRGAAFWDRVLRILTRNRIGTTCGKGHRITVEGLFVTSNVKGTILKCRRCVTDYGRLYQAKRYAAGIRPKRSKRSLDKRRADYQRNREANLAALRAYYQKNRERLLAKANERQRAKRAASRSLEGGSNG